MFPWLIVTPDTEAYFARRRPSVLLGLARRLVDGIVEGYRRRRTIATLAALDDATLKDIGLPRSEIRWVAETGAIPGHGAANENRPAVAA